MSHWIRKAEQIIMVLSWSKVCGLFFSCLFSRRDSTEARRKLDRSSTEARRRLKCGSKEIVKLGGSLGEPGGAWWSLWQRVINMERERSHSG